MNMLCVLYIVHLLGLHLEYCTVIFNSILVYQASGLERVQKRFHVFIHRILNGYTNVTNLDYLDLCALYSLPTLEHRRCVNYCLFSYKHFPDHFSNTDANPYCLYAPVRWTRYANGHIFHVPRSRVEVTKRCFISRISSTYNRLHGMCDVFGASSVSSCRRQVHQAITSINS